MCIGLALRLDALGVRLAGLLFVAGLRAAWVFATRIAANVLALRLLAQGRLPGLLIGALSQFAVALIGALIVEIILPLALIVARVRARVAFIAGGVPSATGRS